jgi:predicted RecB family nuclease
LGRIADHADAAWVAEHGGGMLHRRRGITDNRPPRADIEIDLDVEFDTPPLSYLWGALVTNRSGQEFPQADGYRAFVNWTKPSTKSDRTLFVELWTWLQTVRLDAEQLGRSLAIYCWSSAERTRLLASATSEREAVIELTDHSGLWVDLLAHVRRVAVTPESQSLKFIAKLAGFSWRDDDPGGMASVEWFVRAVDGDKLQRPRLLAYNEDDVLATLAVREWLTNTELPALPAQEE